MPLPVFFVRRDHRIGVKGDGLKMKSGNHTKNLVAYLVGLGTSILIIILGSWLLAKLVLNERIGEGSAAYAVAILLMTATLFGSQLNWRLRRRQRTCTPLVLAVIVALILVVIGLLLDGPVQSLGLNLAGIGVGGVVSYVICLNRRGKSGRRKRRYR